MERRNKKETIRNEILQQKDLENRKKFEIKKLKKEDASYNYERERKRMQEFQDYLLKKQYQKNIYNEEIKAFTAHMIEQQKQKVNSIERSIIDSTVVHQSLKKTKPEQLLAQQKANTEGNDKKQGQ